MKKIGDRWFRRRNVQFFGVPRRQAIAVVRKIIAEQRGIRRFLQGT